jgi:hypothetical protein
VKRDALLVVVVFLLTAVIFIPLVAALGGVSAGLLAFTALFMVPMFLADDLGVDKERDGWPYGLFLSWIGVLVVLFLPPRKIKSVAVVSEDAAGQ